MLPQICYNLNMFQKEPLSVVLLPVIIAPKSWAAVFNKKLIWIAEE